MKTQIKNKMIKTVIATLITVVATTASAYTNFSSASEDLVEIAQQAIDVVNAERPSATYDQLGRYLLPIRKAAVNLQVMGTMHFPSEAKAICAIKRLESTIARAEWYLNEQLETDTGFELAQELMTIQEQLSNFTRGFPSGMCGTARR